MKNKYVIFDNDEIVLKQLGFRHIGDGVYIHDFVGYKWHGYTTITCRFTVFNNSLDVQVDVYSESGQIYAPYYNEEKNNEVLKIIRANISRELKHCNIRIANKEE